MPLQALPRRGLLARAAAAVVAAAVGLAVGLAPELVLLGVLCWVSVLVALAQQALP